MDEQLKPRGKLPELNSGFTRGAPENKWQDPTIVHGVEIIETPEYHKEHCAETKLDNLKQSIADQTNAGEQFNPNKSVTQSAIDQANEASRKFERERKQKQSESLTTEKENFKPMILAVKQMNQWDSKTEEGPRMCGSSVMAMAWNFLSPTTVHHEGWDQLDDYYLKELIEKAGGNTNNPLDHVRALQHLGFNCELRKDCSWATIDRQLQQGIPVPMPIAHHGSSSAPDLERWHWILAVGKPDDPRSKAHIFNDPFGELDVKNGGYQMGDGARMQYSDANLTPRWQTDGPNKGWAILFKEPFPKRYPEEKLKPKPAAEKKAEAKAAEAKEEVAPIAKPKPPAK